MLTCVPNISAQAPISTCNPILRMGAILLMSSINPIKPANKAGSTIEINKSEFQLFEKMYGIDNAEIEKTNATAKPPIFGMATF